MKKLKTIARYPNPTLALLDKERLEAEGISAFIADEQMGTLLGAAGFGGAKLQVEEGDEEKAREIIENNSSVEG